MKQCTACKRVKFWFQFHTQFMGLYTEVFDVCNKCANYIKEDAVRSFNPKKSGINFHR